MTDNPLVFAAEDDGHEARFSPGASWMPLAIHLDPVSPVPTPPASRRPIFWVLSGHDVHNPVTLYLAQDPGSRAGSMTRSTRPPRARANFRRWPIPRASPTSQLRRQHRGLQLDGAATSDFALRSIDLLRSRAIELLVMAQALEHQRPHVSGAEVEKVHARIRDVVPPLTGDRAPAPDIAAVEALIESGEIG